jgi:hypothetical protein
MVNITPLPIYLRQTTPVTIEEAREASGPVWNFGRREKVS